MVILSVLFGAVSSGVGTSLFIFNAPKLLNSGLRFYRVHALRQGKKCP